MRLKAMRTISLKNYQDMYPTREWRTTNLLHLLPTRKKRFIAPRTKFNEDPKIYDMLSVQARIKWWNIVPGDQVRIRGRESEGIREVLAIDKFTNQVYLKERKKPDAPIEPTKPELLETKVKIHYSRCQLLAGQYQLPSQGTSDAPRVVNVFAKRIATSGKAWVQSEGGWVWKRFAAAVIPRMPESVLSGGRLEIPWPKTQRDDVVYPVGLYDTESDEVSKVTWQPPNDLIHPSQERVKEWADMYLDYWSDPSKMHYQRLPLEFILSNELANPHSRRVKQVRWQAAKEERKRLHASILASHLKDRATYKSPKDARAEAEWKFKQLVLHQQKQKAKKRWIQRGGPLRIMARKQKKVRKAKALVRRMNALQFDVNAKNQVVPGHDLMHLTPAQQPHQPTL